MWLRPRKNNAMVVFFDEICTNIYEKVCGDFKCYAGERKDRKNVQFKRVK